MQLRSTEETWILDTAGSQYGFIDALVPYNKYMAENSCRIVSAPATYEWTETKDLDYYATLEFMNKTRAQRENRRDERRSRLHFARFIDHDIEEDVLHGSAADWKDKINRFVAALRAHLLKLVD